MDIVQLFATLPPWIEYKGVTYELHLFINGSPDDVRLGYIGAHLSFDSESQREDYPNFFFLRENIANQWQLCCAIESIKNELSEWLLQNPQ